MRVVLQRVTEASVSVEGGVVGAIQQGFVALVGVDAGDGSEQAEALAAKTAELRVFADAAGKFNRALLDLGGEALVISQFTLLADVRKGRRPLLRKRRIPRSRRGWWSAMRPRWRSGACVWRGGGSVPRCWCGWRTMGR